MGWCSCLDGPLSLRGDMRPRELSERRVIFFVALSQCALNIGVLGGTPIQPPIMVIGCGTSLLVGVILLCLCLCGVRVTHRCMRWVLVVWGTTIILGELHIRTVQSALTWPLFVLLADLALLLRLGRGFATGLIVMVASWVVLSGIESMMRFGLFDLPGTAPDWYRWERTNSLVECSTPPCPVEASTDLFEITLSIIVLFTDFIATRGFAYEAEKEQAAMARTIETVEAIAQLLAGYDVDTVAEMLQEAEAEGRLPAAMHEALHRLEQNLRAYRPYLPKSCLPAEEEEAPEEDSNTSHSLPPSGGSSPSMMRELRRAGVLKVAQATVVVVNMRDTLSHLDHVSSAFQMLLSTVMSAVEAKHGLVDVFIGDRILASFNTARTCMVHGTAAAHAIKSILRSRSHCFKGSGTTMRVSIGAATGRVHCGDMGCAEMRRFNLLGALPILACGMERAARAMDISVLCNSLMRQDAEHEHALLLLPRLVRIVKLHVQGYYKTEEAVLWENSSEAHRVYELPLVHDTLEASTGEWMYEVGRLAEIWAPYTRGMQAFLAGTSPKEAASLAGSHSAEVLARITLLGSREPVGVFL